MRAADDRAFNDNAALLEALLAIGASLVERAVLLWRQASPSRSAAGAATDPLYALYAMADLRQSPEAQLRQRLARLEEQLRQQWNDFVARSAASVRAQVFLPWVHLALLFQLDAQEQALLLWALLPELEPHYGHILRALADDAAAAHCEDFVALSGAALALGGDAAARLALQQRLLGEAALIQWELVELAPGTRLSTLAGGYAPSAAIAAYLLSLAAPQLRMEQPLEEIGTSLALEQHLLDDGVKQQLASVIDRMAADDAPASSFVLQLQGPDLSLQQSLCAAAFQRIGLRCALLDGAAIRRTYHNGQRHRATLLRALRLLCRDALLCNRVLVLTHIQALAAPDDSDDLLDDVCHTLWDSQRYVVALNGPARRIAELAQRYRAHRVMAVSIHSTAPDTQLRQRIWQRHLDGAGLAIDAPILEQLINQYPFTEEQIAAVLREAQDQALQDGGARLEPQRLLDACRERSHSQQLGVAQEVKTPYRFDDIVLPEDTLQWLREVLQYAQHRHQVVEDWGFERKQHNSKNLCVLFYGPSGTGKTMAASILANELNLSLYRIDLSSLVSKYIGDTEKRLAQLFDQAEAMNIVLFFDEAEGLFSKRTDTKDAHDRYANLQTGYLLQRIETYPGIVILSTNLLKNMDPAFVRRFKFMIEYPFPGPAQRLQLWRHAFPATTPTADDLDFALLAERAALSGGNINNIAIAAAFLAAAQTRPVGLQHVLQATEREYHKLGKVFSAADFRWDDDD